MKNDPGIFVTQSVHKQTGGVLTKPRRSTKKITHIRGQARFLPAQTPEQRLHVARFDQSVLPRCLRRWISMPKSTKGRVVAACGRSALRWALTRVKPFSPVANCFSPLSHWWLTASRGRHIRRRPLPAIVVSSVLSPGAKWHGFEGYADDQYFVDPCKLLLTTPGIDADSGRYTEFGIPATILAHYLRENGIVPEKCDLNSILFLLTPAESEEKTGAAGRDAGAI
ncbi:ornithine decarboxylase [Salmonella enterica subsp. enterica]|uniref:Ornithine decarboxylase n=1 Tax=Salmonella enterica I TaxID=59201 RepID=A0A3S4I0A4_SALET|nr:ornithine decarboxylase [Salmonella enterica subsp. enterica]